MHGELLGVGFGINFRQMARQYLDVGLRAGRRQSRFQVAQQEEILGGGTVVGAIHNRGNPYVRAPPGKAFRHDTDNGPGSSVQNESLSDDGWIAREPALPD